MEKYGLALLCFTATLGLGCATTSMNSREVASLKDDVSQLQIQYGELRQNHADLYAKVDSLVMSLGTLNASMQDIRNKTSVLYQTMHDLDSNLDKKVKNDYAESVLPSSVYQGAYGDYSMGKYELAYSGFQSFIDKNPNAELASQAQFYMGECFYSRGMFDKALEDYEKVEERYKRSDLVPSARLKMAMCYEILGKSEELSNILLSILKDFPQSPEALMAKEKIRINKNAQTR